MKNDVYMIRVIIKKEIVDTFRTLGLFLVALTLCFNLCIYITDTQIIELGLPADVVPYQLGLSMMYLMAMTALFLGTTLTNKMIYEEKRTKTMHMILGMGVPKEVMWLGKILAIVIMCALFGVMNILVHVLFVWVKFGVLMKFNSMAITMVFITVPLLCYGFIALASVAYMYFSRMNIVGMFIQIVPYLAVWEVSSELIKFTQVPVYVMLLSLGIGVVALLVSMLLVCGMSKERIVSRVD